MPIKWRSKILLAKIETTYSTDAAPTGAANAILANEVTLSPMEGNDVSRDLDLPYLGAQGTIPTELHAKLAFKVELVGSGTAGMAPGWGPLLRGCGVAEVITAGTSVAYNPVSDAHESITLHLWIGATRYAIVGARGNCRLRIEAQKIPYLEFEFTGLFTLPAETARVTTTLTAFQKPDVVARANTPVFTLDGASLVMRSFLINLGNAVEGRFLVGSEDILITDKAETIQTSIEAVPLTTFDPFAKAASQAAVAVALTHGTVAGRRVQIAVPKAQVQRLQGLENSQNIKEWPLRMVPLPNSGAGNDQWTLTLN